jgi:GTP cyclohydrolase II
MKLKATLRNKVKINSEFGPLELASFHGLEDGKEHVAILIGDWKKNCANVRIHSECFTGDILGSLNCECGKQLSSTMKNFKKTGGVILYLRQEGRGIGLYNKLDAYELQNNGFDTVQANNALGFPDDLREFKVAADMLQVLELDKVFLHTNNPKKIASLKENGIDVLDRIGTEIFPNKYNLSYLKTKVKKSGHLINLTKGSLCY